MRGIHAMHPCYLPGCTKSMPSQTTLECGHYGKGVEFVTRTPLAPGWGVVKLFAANTQNDLILVCPEHLSSCVEAGCLLVGHGPEQ